MRSPAPARVPSGNADDQTGTTAPATRPLPRRRSPRRCATRTAPPSAPPARPVASRRTRLPRRAGHRRRRRRLRDRVDHRQAEAHATEAQSQAQAGQRPRFATCKAAKAAGYGPYHLGRDPEYHWYRDADSDGRCASDGWRAARHPPRPCRAPPECSIRGGRGCETVADRADPVKRLASGMRAGAPPIDLPVMSDAEGRSGLLSTDPRPAGPQAAVRRRAGRARRRDPRLPGREGLPHRRAPRPQPRRGRADARPAPGLRLAAGTGSCSTPATRRTCTRSSPAGRTASTCCASAAASPATRARPRASTTSSRTRTPRPRCRYADGMAKAYALRGEDRGTSSRSSATARSPAACAGRR